MLIGARIERRAEAFAARNRQIADVAVAVEDAHGGRLVGRRARADGAAVPGVVGEIERRGALAARADVNERRSAGQRRAANVEQAGLGDFGAGESAASDSAQKE